MARGHRRGENAEYRRVLSSFDGNLSKDEYVRSFQRRPPPARAWQLLAESSRGLPWVTDCVVFHSPKVCVSCSKTMGSTEHLWLWTSWFSYYCFASGQPWGCNASWLSRISSVAGTARPRRRRCKTRNVLSSEMKRPPWMRNRKPQRLENAELGRSSNFLLSHSNVIFAIGRECTGVQQGRGKSYPWTRRRSLRLGRRNKKNMFRNLVTRWSFPSVVGEFLAQYAPPFQNLQTVGSEGSVGDAAEIEKSELGRIIWAPINSLPTHW